MGRYTARTIERNASLREAQDKLERATNAKLNRDEILMKSIRSENLSEIRRQTYQLFSQKVDLIEENRLKQLCIEKELRESKEREFNLKEQRERCLKQQSVCEEKKRLQLRQQSEELRCLERRLQQAYVSKIRSQQLSDLRARKMKARAEELNERDSLINEIKKIEKEELHNEEILKIKGRKYLNDLEAQLIEKDLRREEEYQQFLREKEMIDGIVRDIELEDARIAGERAERIEEARKEMELRIQEREIRRKLDKNWERDTAHLNSNIEEMEKRQAVVNEQRSKRLESLRELQSRLSEQLLEAQRVLAEKEQIRLELDEEEMREKALHDEAEEEVRQQRLMKEIRSALQMQLREREIMREKEIVERQQTHKAMMKKLAEEQRVDRMTAEARRRRLVEHREQVEEMMEENRRRRNAEIQRFKDEDAKLVELERTRLEMVASERKRILKEHAASLSDFLPQDFLDSVSDDLS